MTNSTVYTKGSNTPTVYINDNPTYPVTINVGMPMGLLLSLTYPSTFTFSKSGYNQRYTKQTVNQTSWTLE